MEKNWFTLEKHCFLIKGAKRAAIYDLVNGDIYSVNEHATELLERCENGVWLEEILKNQSTDIQVAFKDHLKKLEELRLGHFSQENGLVKKIAIEPPKPLDFMWLEVTRGCNLRCVHCYSTSLPALLGKEKMTENDWIRVMKEGADIDCRKLQFIGGEPFALGEQLFRLIIASRNLGFETIEVYTNATLIDENAIRFLAENQIAVAVSVYGKDKEIHEQVTQIPGSSNQVVANLRRLVAENIKVRVGIVAMSINENHVEETVYFLKNDIGIKNINIDIIRPAGRGDNNRLVPVDLYKKYQLCKPLFPKCTLENFRYAKYGHNCFSKDICISADGRVFPCIMEREMILGDVLKMSLQEILEKENSKQIRSLSKDHIKVCQHCEYRYCCFDCRPKAKKVSSTGDFYAKPAECLYDPCAGEWKKN